MKNFKKLSKEEQLKSVKGLIATFPKEEHEKLVRELIINKDDQEKMIADLKEDK